MLFRGAPRTGNWATQKSRTGSAETWWQMAAKVSGHEKLLEHFFFSFLILIVSIKKKGAEGRKKKMENGAYGQKKEMHSQIYFLFLFFSCSSSFFLFRVQNIR